MSLLLTAVSFAHAEEAATLNLSQARARAEAFVARGIELSPGKVAPQAWGYRSLPRTAGDDLQFLFPVIVQPIPHIKGNETAWGILIEVDPRNEEVWRAHGAIPAYLGRPFEGFTRFRS